MIWRQILGYLPLNIVQGVAGFAAIVVLTRILSPEDYGRYALVLAVVQLAHVASFTWLHGALARFYAQARRDLWMSRYLTTGYASFAVCAAVAAIIYVGIVKLWSPEAQLETTLYFGLGLLLMRAFLMMGLEVHKAAQQITRFTALEMLYTILGLSAGVALILKTDLASAGPLAGLMLAAGICLFIDLPRQFAIIAKAPQLSSAKARLFLSYGVPVSLSLILEQTLLSSDRFLIQHFLGEASVGVYAAAHATANRTLDVMFIWLSAGILPLAMTAYETEGVEKTRQIMRRYGEILLLIALPAAAGLALVAGPLASVMVGAQFQIAASQIIPWIALAALMNGIMTYYVHHAFLLAHRTGTMAAAMILPTIANIGLNLLLLPAYGLQGALIATVCAYFLGLVLCVVVGRRYFPIPLLTGAVARTLIAVAVMSFAVYSLPLRNDFAGLALGVGVGMGTYSLMAFLLNLADCRDTALRLPSRIAALRLRHRSFRGTAI